jgi:two-component system vancomycin resistance associated response regulator VraR
MKNEKLKIVLYDPYVLALDGMYDAMKMIHDIEVVGAYSEESDFFNHLKTKKVDIVVIDMMLKSSQGLAFIKKIQEVQDNVKIVVLTEMMDSIVYKRALEMGVNAFLKKDISYSELISVIVSVGKGNYVIPDFVMEENTNTILTETETKILKLLVEENTNEEIAKEMFISRRTVESHISNIFRKLEVDSRIGAVRKAIALELV